MLSLNEAGYIFDDGLVALTGPNDYFVSTTSSGADAAEGWFRDWKDTWKMKVHIVNQTAVQGAINVAGPKSRELLARLTRDPVDREAIPYSGIARITVRGIPCLAVRVGFTGELSYELHHPASRSVELWNSLLEAGADLDIAPHGLEALKLLRLEKGHIIVGQDTDFDTTPHKVGMDWAVKMEKPYFVGRSSIERLAGNPPGQEAREHSLRRDERAGRRRAAHDGRRARWPPVVEPLLSAPEMRGRPRVGPSRQRRAAARGRGGERQRSASGHRQHRAWSPLRSPRREAPCLN